MSTTAYEQPEQVSEVVVREPMDNTRAIWINRARSADHNWSRPATKGKGAKPRSTKSTARGL